MGKYGAPDTVCGLLGTGRTKANELAKRADFPKAIYLGKRCVRYVKGDIIAWIKAQQQNTEAGV